MSEPCPNLVRNTSETSEPCPKDPLFVREVSPFSETIFKNTPFFFVFPKMGKITAFQFLNITYSSFLCPLIWN